MPDYVFLGKGWSFLNRRIDDYDVEWQTWKSFITNYWYCFVVHSVSAEVFRFLKLKVSASDSLTLNLTNIFLQNISFLFFLIGSSSCLIMYNLQFLLIMYLQTLISFIVSSFFRRRIHVWALALFWLVILNYLKFESNFSMITEILNIDEVKIHDFLVIFAWCLLKNISFNLERAESSLDKRDQKFNLINCLGYVFYFPTFLGGPHVIFSRYADMLDRTDDISPSRARYQSFVLNLLRFTFWFFVTELALHFFYIHSIVINLDLKLMNSLTFFGLGYLMGQFFNNKYIVHYGVPITFGEIFITI